MTAPAPLVATHPGWEDRVRDSFTRQRIMATLGAEIAQLEPGHVVVAMPYNPDVAQQHGYLHAGATATLADSACGYAAFTTAAPGHTVLTVEFKINLLAPAAGQRFTADGTVLRAGRRLSVCSASVFAHEDGDVRLVAQMQATIMLLPGEDRQPTAEG